MSNANLIIRQGEDRNFVFENQIEEVSQAKENYEELLFEARANLTDQDRKITELKMKIDSLKTDTIPSVALMSELLVHYPNLLNLQGAWIETVKDSTSNRIPLFLIQWNNQVRYKRTKKTYEDKISTWLKFKLKSDTIVIVH